MLRKACADPGTRDVLTRNEMHTCKALESNKHLIQSAVLSRE
jgi:hypothetical protein